MYVTNNRWIEIRFTAKGKPFFVHKGKRYHLDNFIRCHSNPWVSDVYPSYIHGYEANNYYDPLFIEINYTGEAVKLYRLEN